MGYPFKPINLKHAYRHLDLHVSGPATNKPDISPSRNSTNPRHETVLAISKRGWFANPPNFQKRNCRLENARRLLTFVARRCEPWDCGDNIFLMLEGGFSLRWFESPMLVWELWRFGNIFRCKWSDCYSTTIYPKIFLRFSSTIPTEAKPRSPSIAFNDRSKVEDLRMTRNNQMDIKNKIPEKKWPLR